MLEKTIKGIKYRLNEENLTAEVIQKKGYEGDFIIPEIVVFKKVDYRVTSIEEETFKKCSSLTSITFNGTKAQWKGIKLGEDWNNEVPTKVIHCTDGDVEI
jgi:hypothetical protein